jgi:hypothetical protein
MDLNGTEVDLTIDEALNDDNGITQRYISYFL